MQPAPSYKEAGRRAEEALELARADGDVKMLQRKLDAAYALWSKTAEIDVASMTGAPPAKWGLRGKKANVIWRSIIPEAVPRKAASRASTLTWIRGIVSELRRITTVLDESAGEGLFIDRAADFSYRPHGATFATPVRGGYDGAGARRRGQVARGGRPRPPTDLDACAKIVAGIRGDLDDNDEQADAAADLGDWHHAACQMCTRTLAAIGQCQAAAFHGDDKLGSDLDDIILRIGEAEKKEEEARGAAEQRGWKEWLEGDWHKGARHAFLASRLPDEWHPTVAVSEKRGGVRRPN